MSTDSYIAIIVVLAVAALLVIKVWGYQALKVKMDESAIINFLESSKSESCFHSTETIAAETNISACRVSAICASSHSIQAAEQPSECWCLK